MLSYRHSFHAGNFADVLKHIVLIEILEYLSQKDTPFEYVDTHSGAGLYNLHSDEALKLEEHSNGIAKLNAQDFPELESYFETVASFNEEGRLDYYPGSPVIAQHFLRDQDRAWLYELHPADFELLRNNIRSNRKKRVHFSDGFKGLDAVIPLTSRRGLVLIDPSYEIKSDYDLVVDKVIKSHKKFNNGVYTIWYPVVDRSTIDAMQARLLASGIKNIQCFELGISEDSTAKGMTSSGMIVVNPPWVLFDKMSALLPKLADRLKAGDNPVFKCDILSGE